MATKKSGRKRASWQDLLQRKKDGEPHPSLNNIQLIFEHDPPWEDVLAYDQFLGDIVTKKLPPWPKDIRPSEFRVGPWSDNDNRRAAIWLERLWGIRADVRLVQEGLYVVADTRKFHPVQEWLRGLRWDRTLRLDRMLRTFCRAPDNPYVNEVSKNFLIGAVARVMRPGCQLDTMPILEGVQGIRKTTFLKALFGPEWFMSSNIDITHKDGYAVLQQKWLVEMGELQALSNKEITAIKQYITQAVDRYRPSYGRRAMDFPRQSIFCGTTNGESYLKDPTGARRFQPVSVSGIKGPDGTRSCILPDKEDREQLFAEAYVRYKKGEAWHIQDTNLLKLAAYEAEDRRQQHPWEHLAARWVNDLSKTGGGRRRLHTCVTTAEFLEEGIGKPSGTWTKGDEMQAAESLKTAGLLPTRRVLSSGVQTRGFFAGRSENHSKSVTSPEVGKVESQKRLRSQPANLFSLKSLENPKRLRDPQT